MHALPILIISFVALVIPWCCHDSWTGPTTTVMLQDLLLQLDLHGGGYHLRHMITAWRRRWFGRVLCRHGMRLLLGCLSSSCFLCLLLSPPPNMFSSSRNALWVEVGVLSSTESDALSESHLSENLSETQSHVQWFEEINSALNRIYTSFMRMALENDIGSSKLGMVNHSKSTSI